MFVFSPVGLLDPVSCRNNRCSIIVARIAKGSRKWKAKNRVNVALSTEKPPQTQFTMVGPIYGMADNRFVITVAPQNDICPQGSTYPMKAVAMTRISRTTPMFQVVL